MSSPTIEAIRNLVAENKAILLESKHNLGYTDYLLVRYWKDIDEKYLSACADFLETNTSAKNKTAGQYVENPMASNDEKPGTWHGAPVEIRTDREGNRAIFQTLFKGSMIVDWFLVEDSADEQVHRKLYLSVIEKPTLPADDPANGITYRMSEAFVDNFKGTFTLWIDRRTKLNQSASDVSGASDLHEEQAYEILDKDVNTQAAQPLADITQVAGHIDRTENTPISSGWKTERTNRTAIEKDDAIKIKEISAFESAEEVVNRNKSAPVSEQTDQLAGKIVESRAEYNDFKLYDNKTKITTAIEKTNAELSKQYEADKVVDVVKDVNLATEPTLPSSLTEGVLVTMQKALNRFLRWDKVTTTVTSTESLYPTGTTDLSWTGKNGTYYGKFLFNVRKANLEGYIQAFANRHSGFSVSGAPGSRNPDGTYDAVLVAAPLSGGGLSGDAWTTGTASFSYTNRKGQAVTVYKKFTTSLSAAQTFMGTSAGGTIVGSDEGHVTDIFPSTNGKIVAIRVEVT